ncbi:MAG: peptidoglycan recognition family protein [Hyphomicrobiaceae bacterium]
MPAPFQARSPSQFLDVLRGFPWARRIWRVDMHHTYAPDHARWRQIGSAACQEGMCRYHVADRGFADIAQHVSIMPDGSIWSGRDWNMTPASVGYGMNRGVFMFEAVGNFDVGCDRLEGAQLESVLLVIRSVQIRFALPPEALLFHREVPQTEKTCPGSGVSKAEILRAVRGTPIIAVAKMADLTVLPVEAL